MPVYGNPIVPDLPVPADMLVREPETPAVFGETAIQRKYAVKTEAGVARKISAPFYTDSGSLLVIPATGIIKVKIEDAVYDKNPQTVTDVEIDFENSRVHFDLPVKTQNNPGVYTASLGLFQTVDAAYPSHIYNFYVYNEPSSWVTNETCGLPTIAEVRMSLRDSSPVENEIFGDHVFGIEEIADAAVRTVLLWNETPPPILHKNTQEFRYKTIWLTGIHLFLFEIFIEWLRKNRLPYSAGGVQTDELNKLPDYLQSFQLKYQELRKNITAWKVIANTSRGFARLI